MSKQFTPDERRALAEKHGINEQYLYQCLTGRRDMNPAEALRIETESGGVLTRQMLCKKTWRGIWPNLVNPETSTDQPQSTATIAPAATKPIARTPFEEALRDAMMPVLMVSKHEKPGDRRSESHPPEADLERRENEAAALVRAEEEAAKNAKKG